MDSKDIVDRDVVFGHYWKRASANFATLGKLKLVAGGLIEGSRRTNEAFWKVTNGSLAFFHLRGDVTTRFDEIWSANSTVLLGKSFAEQSVNFVFPYRSLAQVTPRIVYLVSSCVGYEFALERLLSQLRKLVPLQQIWVTIAHSDRCEIRCADGIKFSHVTEKAFEYAALLDLGRQDLHYDFAFLIHDTCDVGPRLPELISQQVATIEWDYMSASTIGLFNIGLYRRSFITNLRPFLSTFDGMSKMLAIDVELDRAGQGFKSIATVTTNFLDGRNAVTGFQNVYEPTVFRRGVYLLGADVHKFHGSFRPSLKGWQKLSRKQNKTLVAK